jgi:hypothetical protein
MGTRVLPGGLSGQAVKLDTQLHLGPRLRVSGAIPLLPPICLYGVNTDTFTFVEDSVRGPI